MDVKKVQDIITWLAKSGDKETLRQVGEALLEISNFSKSTPTQKETKPKLNESMSSHASALLDGTPSSYTVFKSPPPSYERPYVAPQTINPNDVLSQFIQPEQPTYQSPFSSPNEVPYTPGPRNLANNVGVTSHASHLLG